MEAAITVLIWLGVIALGLYVLVNLIIIGVVLWLYWRG